MIISDEYIGILKNDSELQLRELLAEDPRPHYHKDPERVYGFIFQNHEIKFKVMDNVLTVIGIFKV